MGGYLERPETTKETAQEDGFLVKGDRVSYGVSSMQGWRVAMEDTHLHKIGLQRGDDPKHRDAAIFGVFDGHGGGSMSEYMAKNLLEELWSFEKFAEVNSASGPDSAIVLGSILRDSFFSIDAKVQKCPEVQSGAVVSGTTAVVLLLTATHLIVANTGDSRLAVCTGFNDRVRFATEDHKPDNELESRRIKAAGGTVQFNRVNGDLAMSRALGDYQYKNNSKLSARCQQVIPEPDLTLLERSAEDKFVVLACDGIWDMMTTLEVCSFVSNKLEAGLSLGAVCDSLIDYCFDLGSKDNMSVLLVCLSSAPWDKIGRVEIESHKSSTP